MMKSKKLSLKIILISVLVLVMAFSVSALLWNGSARAAEGYDLNIQGEVLEGITVTGSDVKVEIPSNVKKVADRAFLGKTDVAEITFADGSELTEIGDAAFNNTGITKITLPSNLQKIGAGAFSENSKLEYVTFAGNKVTEVGVSAFGNCENLKYVVLPENAAQIDFCKIEGSEITGNYGGSTFNNSSAYLITPNRDSYDALMERFAEPANKNEPEDVTVGDAVLDGSDVVVTYPVTVYYFNDTTKLAEEVCLSADYLVKYDSAEKIWKEAAASEIGERVGLTGLTWYCNSRLISGIAGATAALKAATGEEVRFYTFDPTPMVFEARYLVYDKDITYTMDRFNELLTTSSSRLTSGMSAVIMKYEKPDGSLVYTRPEEPTDEDDLLESFHDAGTYYVNIYAGEQVNEENFEIVIVPKTVNLGDYSNLAWKIDGATDLRDKYLFIYTTKTGGREYPSEEMLSADMISKLSLNTDYKTASYVYYSVASNTGSATTIAIADNEAYTVSYNSSGRTSTLNTYGSEQSYVGTYKASATITANDNYILAGSYESTSRGLNIDVQDEGATATVTKTWYVVNVNNRIVYGANESDYVNAFASSYTYGADSNSLPEPQLTYKPFGSSSENYIHIELYLDGNKVYGSATPSTLKDYVNASMPAGAYRMVITVDPIARDENGEKHDGFVESFTFTVEKAEITRLRTFNDAIKGKTFTYEWENGVSHFYDNSYGADTAWNSFVAGFGVERIGVWALSNYNSYYVNPEIGYKLDNSKNAPYYSKDILSTAAVQTYKVYYNITAPSYTDFVETPGVNWNEYYFEVVNVMTVDVPTVASKTYNGQTLIADLDYNSSYYTVETNNGGINAGTYEVVLRLKDEVHYMWNGQSIGNIDAYKTLTFEILSTQNSFTVKPRIESWTQGQFNEENNRIEVEALHGSVKIRIVNTDAPDDILYDAENGTAELTELLKGLKAGSYMITAYVDGNDNFTDINDSFILLVFEKDGLPWWLVLIIVVGTLIVVLGIIALVFYILHEKGVLQMLMGKVVIAMRARATVDATIAAVRANKVAAESRKSIAKAEALDRIEQLRAEHKAEMAKPADEQAATLEEKAQVAAKSAEVMQKRAEDIKRRAEAIKYYGTPAQAKAEQTEVHEDEVFDDHYDHLPDDEIDD